MAVLEALTDEECALYAIITDESGIDLAEFCWKDDSSPNGVWRAWAYQWSWWRETNKLSVDCCARSVGKSVSLQLSGFAFPFVRPNQEMLITAPELVHLQPVTQAIESRILSVRLARELLDKKNRGTGFTHQPFGASFSNGSRILGRIPQRDGKGVKGTHPSVLQQDEASDYPAPGWTELYETLRFGRDDAYWRAHGVTRGVRDEFYKITQPDSGWRVHKITAMHRPDWSDEERRQKEKMYGSRNSPDYKRNIYGEHGDHTNPLFVLARLAACFDMNEISDYNVNGYVYEKITAEKLAEHQLPVEEFVKVPAQHYKYDRVWMGMDVGMTNHPSEILVFAEEPKEKRGNRVEREVSASVLRLVSRWHLERISAPDQRRIIRKLYSIYKPKAFSMDKTGVGLPIYQELLQEDPTIARIVKGYNFSSKIPVDFEDPENVEDSLIMRRVLEFSSDKLREYVDSGWIKMPRDIDLFREWQGQTYTVTKTTQDPYGRRTYSQGSFHTLDAGRMAICGHALYNLEALLAEQEPATEDVLDIFYT